MLFKGVKDKNVLKHAKEGLKIASKFNKIIKSLYNVRDKHAAKTSKL